jgi:hypothetical protein
MKRVPVYLAAVITALLVTNVAIAESTHTIGANPQLSAGARAYAVIPIAAE